MDHETWNSKTAMKNKRKHNVNGKINKQIKKSIPNDGGFKSVFHFFIHL